MHGGKRPGAGRTKGARGRVTQEVAEVAAAKGITPLNYMLEIMRDENAPPTRRDDMAKAAAPYIHRKQPRATEVSDSGRKPVVVKIVEFVSSERPADSDTK